MKHKFITLSAIALFLSLNLSATVWRVNNTPGISVGLTSFTAAQSAAAANDTLYFEGSVISYGNITITKPLTIIGPGYFLTQNPQTQANMTNASFGTISFSTGSSGSKISGLNVTGTVTIAVGNIEISGNFLIILRINSTNSFGNILIAKNYFAANDELIQNSSGSATIYNLVITNNIFDGGTTTHNIALDDNYSCIISNNVLDNAITASNSTIINNIQKSGYTGNWNNNVYYNNIGSGTQFPDNNGNQRSIVMTDVFVGATGYTTDSQWQLKPGSPAIGAANDGGDCGIFGGPTPYILSGMPPIPAVYEINMPASGSNISGINVTVKAKSH